MEVNPKQTLMSQIYSWRKRVARKSVIKIDSSIDDAKNTKNGNASVEVNNENELDEEDAYSMYSPHSGIGEGLFGGGFNRGAEEAGFTHDSAHAGVVENGYDELFEFDLDNEEMLLLLLEAAAALVSLCVLELMHLFLPLVK
ncbi:uncharacterized protein G2W53_010505 [Senna tora]|uniref:Uncharacterized protein n=1 Tax=Senna tora TaxID=362788 RepID=A0A835C9I0_9FABA|nr:uncharacterized protein G2W53_010505 [Senna tora]